MSEPTTLRGYYRTTGSDSDTPAVSLACIQFTFDPTQASASVSKILPAGAIPVGVQNIDGGATGGASPTIDIGTGSDPDGFANELRADLVSDQVSSIASGGGSLMGVELTVDTIIQAGVGASAAAAGTVKAAIYYIMADDGAA